MSPKRTLFLLALLAGAIGVVVLQAHHERAPYWPEDDFRGETFTVSPLRWRLFGGAVVQRPAGWSYHGGHTEVQNWLARMMAWEGYAGIHANTAFRRLPEFRDMPGGSARAYDRPPCRTVDPDDDEPEPCNWRMTLPPSGREPLKATAGESS